MAKQQTIEFKLTEAKRGVSMAEIRASSSEVEIRSSIGGALDADETNLLRNCSALSP